MASVASASPLSVSIVPITSSQNWINVCDPSPSYYQITLTNPAGNVPVDSIGVDVTIPQGLGYVGGTTTINYPGGSSNQDPQENGQQISWDFSSLVASLEPGQQITIRFALKAGCSAIGAPASAVRADVTCSEGSSWAATSSTVRVNSGLLKVTKSPTVIEAEVGQEIVWTITVTNLGTGPAYSAKLVDSVGSGLQPLGQTEWNWDVIAAGASQQVNFPAKVISCENLFERATASWGCEAAPCQSNYAEGSIKIILKDPKFVFNPPSSISVPYCSKASVSIPYRNDGPGKAFNVHVHLGNLPAQYEITNIQGAVFQDSTLLLGDLDAGASGTITFDLGMKSSGGCGAPGAVIIFTPNYFDGCGNGWTPPLTLVNIGIDPSTTPSLSSIKTQVTPSGDSIKLGEEITYSLTAAYSPGPCQGIIANIVDSYPEGFEVTDNGGGMVDPEAHTITWSGISMNQANPTWSATIKLKASFDPCLCGKTVTNRLDITPNPAEDCCGCPLSASSSSSVFINCDSLFTSSKTSSSPQENCRVIEYTTTYEFSNVPQGLTWSMISFRAQGNNGQVFSPPDTTTGPAQFSVTNGGTTNSYNHPITLGQFLSLDFLSSETLAAGTRLDVTYQLYEKNTGSFVDWSDLQIQGYPAQCGGDPVYHQGVSVKVGRSDFSIALNLKGANKMDTCGVYPVSIDLSKNGPYDGYQMAITYDDTNYRYLGRLQDGSDLRADISGINGSSPAAYQPRRSGNVLTWRFDTASLGGSISFYVEKRCPQDKTMVSTLNYLDNCGDLLSGSDTKSPLLLGRGNLTLKKTPETIFVTKDILRWRIYSANTGSGTAFNSRIVDTLDPGLTYIPGSAKVNGVNKEPDENINNQILTWKFGDILIQQGKIIEFDVKISSCAPLKNKVESFWGCQDGDCQTLSDEAITDLSKLDQLTVQQSTEKIDPCGVAASSYEIDFVNSGEVNVYNIKAEEDLPSWLEIVPGSDTYEGPTPTTKNLDGNPLVWTYDDTEGYPPNTHGKIKFQVNLKEACTFVSGQSATATVTYVKPCGDLGRTATIPNQIQSYQPRISITKTCTSHPNRIANLGDTVEWQIVLTSNSDPTVTNARLEDTLPAGTEYVSADPAPDNPTESPLKWTIGSMGAGESRTITLKAKVTGCVANTQDLAKVLWGCCPTQQSRESTVPLKTAPIITITQSLSNLNTCGANMQIVIKNDGSTATTTEIRDVIPAGFLYKSGSTSISSNQGRSFANPEPSFNPDTRTLTWTASNIDKINPLETITINFQIENCQDCCMTSEPSSSDVKYDYKTPCDETKSASNSIPVQPPKAVLSISKVPHQQAASDTVSWTVTAQNTGNANAENIEIVDILGDGFSNIAFTPLGGVQGVKTENSPQPGFTTITWTGLSIPAAGSITGTISATASKKQLDMNNDISIKGACPSGCIYSSDSDHAEVSDIELTKTPKESRKTIGEEADFNVVVEFFSNVAYKNVQIIDTIPAGLKYLSAICDVCGSDPEVTTDPSGNTILKWTLGDFLGPRICNITIKTVVKNITSNVDPTDLINNVEVKHTIDGSEKTVSDSAVVRIIEPKLVLEKRAHPTTAEAGDKIEFTLHLYHDSASNSPAYDVDIIDTIPAELAYVPGSIQIVSGPSGTADPSGSPQLKWHFDQVDLSWISSNPIVLKYEARMGNVNPGLKITNTAKATWSSLPPNPENPEIRDNYHSSSSQDVYSMKVTLEKTSQPKPLDVNEELTYTIRYLIEGVTDATNVLIKEEYDDNVEFVSANPAPCPSEGDNNIWKSGCPLPVTIQPGEYTIKIVVKPKLPLKNGTIIKNLVKYKSDQMGEKEINVTEENEILSPIPIVKKIANPNTVRAGSELRYKIQIENAGKADATDVVVSDEYDPRVEFVSSDIPPDDGTNNRWTFPLLKPGEKKEINIVVKVQSTVPNGAILINTYRMETKQSDPIEGTLETPVVNKLIVSKKTTKEAAVRGEEIPYTITICNPSGIPATNVVVTDVFSSEVELLWAYPQPLPSGGWFFPVIGPGECVQIEFAVRVPSPEADFQMGQSVEGSGFVNVANDYKTTLPGFVLRNYVTVTSDKLMPSYARVDVNIKSDPGTELKTREHGSGIYDTEEKIVYKLGNKSIEMAKDLKADHKPTSFTYPGNWSIDYGSKWTESAKAKNRATGATMEETYRYATSLDRDSYMKLDKNGSLMVVNSSFEGMGYIGFTKHEAPNFTIHSSPLFESREDYSGRFKIYEKIQEYGRSVRSEQSANGTGAVAAEKQITKSQKSYQYGVGSYQLEELVDSPSNYISKEVNLSHSPYSFTYGPNRTIDREGLWKEGMWSKVENTSFIGEEFDSLNYLHKDSSAKGLNEMETEAEFSGQARLRAEVKGSVSLDDHYVGDLSLKRKILLGGTAKYDQPHLWVAKEGKIAKGVLNGKETVFAKYTIHILNDGSRSLGPIHITDYLPPEATYVNSSLMPDSLGAGYVNWTLVYLGVGMSNTIELTLAAKEEQPDLVNRVLVEGGYDNSWVLASNMSVIENSWLSCCPPQMQLSKKAWIEPSSPNTVWYKISLRNRANYTMAATLTDSLPDSMVLINSSTAPDRQDTSQLVWNIIDLEPGQEKSVIYSTRALRNGSFTNLAKVEAYSLMGLGSVTAEVAATVTIGDVNPPEKNEGEDWKGHSCMGLNCTQMQVGNDFISCHSCGGADAQNLCTACSKPACQDCFPEYVM